MNKNQTRPKTIRVQNLLARYQASWDEWQNIVAGISDAGYLAPNVSKQWSLHDVLGHLAAYMGLMTRHLRAYRKRKRLASGRAPSYSYFNRREAARRKKIPRAQVQSELESSFHDFMQLLSELNDDDLAKKFPSAWSNSTYTPSLGSTLREEANHIHAHAVEVRQWRQSHHVGK